MSPVCEKPHLKTKTSPADDKIHYNYFKPTDQGSNVTLAHNLSYIVVETNTEGIKGENTELAIGFNIDVNSDGATSAALSVVYNNYEI